MRRKSIAVLESDDGVWDIEYTYRSGSKSGDYHQPDDPGEIEIHSIKDQDGNWVPENITGQYEDEIMEAINRSLTP